MVYEWVFFSRPEDPNITRGICGGYAVVNESGYAKEGLREYDIDFLVLAIEWSMVALLIGAGLLWFGAFPNPVAENGPVALATLTLDKPCIKSSDREGEAPAEPEQQNPLDLSS